MDNWYDSIDRSNIMIKIGNVRKKWNTILNENESLSEFKAWLAEQYANGTPVIVEYVLAEEETTPYTEEQATAKKQIDSLKTYRTVTNISNNQNTNMVLTYKKDIQAQFAEYDAKMGLQLQQIQALILESGV